MTAASDRAGLWWLAGGLAGGIAVPALRFLGGLPLAWAIAGGAGLFLALAVAGAIPRRGIAVPEVPLFGRGSPERVRAVLAEADRARTELLRAAAAIADQKIRNRFESLAQTVEGAIGSIARNPNRIARAELLLSRDVPALAQLAREYAQAGSGTEGEAQLDALRRIDADLRDLTRGAAGIGEDELAASIAKARELGPGAGSGR